MRGHQGGNASQSQYDFERIKQVDGTLSWRRKSGMNKVKVLRVGLIVLLVILAMYYIFDLGEICNSMMNELQTDSLLDNLYD